KARQRRPGRNEGLLHHVLGLLEVVYQRECRAEGELLETAGQLDERRHVAATNPSPPLLLVPGDNPFPTKGRWKRVGFWAGKGIFSGESTGPLLSRKEGPGPYRGLSSGMMGATF